MTAKAVLIIGASCTGKSTLGTALAKQHNATYVPEYLRTYLENKPRGYLCTYDDLTPIAQGQMDSEEIAIKTANRYCFIDTSLLLLNIYSQHYFNQSPPIITDNLLKHSHDLILVTDETGIDWVDDGIRDSPHERSNTQQEVIKELNKYNLPFYLISGDLKSRLRYVNQLLKTL